VLVGSRFRGQACACLLDGDKPGGPTPVCS